jgi:two-component system OmpR family sensor kinase
VIRIGHYFRRGLQRRIFLWFGISIAVTGMVVMRFVGVPNAASQMERARHFLAAGFAAVWEQPAARRELVTGVTHDFGIAVQLFDAAHAPLTSAPACRGPALEDEVVRDGRRVGYIALCQDRRHSFAWAPLLIAGVMLWGASGAISRRLVRPLVELSRVARDIGEGQLKSRVKLARRTSAEFVVLGDVINEMASRIEKQLADQRALLATVSHEIRTPLARMRLVIEIAREKAARPPSAPRAHDELTQLEREIVDIDTLVSDLLASSRLDFDAMTRTRIDARKVATDALERAEVDAGRLMASAGDTTLIGDATLIARAVTNLLENAKRHGRGVDALRVAATATTITFVVEDRGDGFEPGEEQRAFEPFYRGPSRSGGDRGDAASVGLGLALVRRIAEAHHGRAFARNLSRGGAQVGIELARGEWTGRSTDPASETT